MRDDDSAERNHFKIGEVATLVGVRPHVLRYWEQEFSALRPKKTRGAHRHYSRANLELAKTIRALVVDQGYSIAGARKKLADDAKDVRTTAGRARGEPAGALLREDLLAIRAALVGLRASLEADDGEVDRVDVEETTVAVPVRAEKRR